MKEISKSTHLEKRPSTPVFAGSLRAILPTLRPWQTITHLIQVSAHSGSVLGLELPVGILSFVEACAVLVKTDVKNVVLSATCLPVFFLRRKQEQRNSHSYLWSSKVYLVLGFSLSHLLCFRRPANAMQFYEYVIRQMLTQVCMLNNFNFAHVYKHVCLLLACLCWTIFRKVMPEEGVFLPKREAGKMGNTSLPIETTIVDLCYRDACILKIGFEHNPLWWLCLGLGRCLFWYMWTGGVAEAEYYIKIYANSITKTLVIKWFRQHN